MQEELYDATFIENTIKAKLLDSLLNSLEFQKEYPDLYEEIVEALDELLLPYYPESVFIN